jgi:hypothetical protein
MTTDRTNRAKQFLARISGGLESASPIDGGTIERLPQRQDVPHPPELIDAVQSAAKKVTSGEAMSAREQFAMEAIIIPDKRPAIDIVNGDYAIVHPDWLSFNNDPIKTNLRQIIPSVGRIELPHNPTLPYAGTGFVVAGGLLMTNRHVAEIFSSGLGLRDLVFLSGREAGIDFLREKGSITSNVLTVRHVVMIHPYWDMALLRVDGLGPDRPPLRLSLTHPEDLVQQDIAVIGYPAFDPRNDADVQNTVFGGVYYVKRLQPGKIGARRSIQSFSNNVFAVTHDSSTLGGNSGSVVVHAATGQVVGLHFAGVYLDANFAVPTSELARDSHVVDAGLNFQTEPQPEPAVSKQWWRDVQPAEGPALRTTEPSRQDVTRPTPQTGAGATLAAPPTPTTASGAITLTIPLEISVRLGNAVIQSAGEVPKATAEPIRQPSGGSELSTPTVDDPTTRARAAVAEGPITFRDHFVSLYQSAVADMADKIAAEQKAGIESLSQDSASELLLAAQAIAQRQTSPLASSQPATAVAGKESVLEKMSVTEHATACASLAWQYMQAKAFGDTVSTRRLEGELDAGTCDPRWAQTITEYVKYFGVNGARAHPQYIAPAQAGETIITIKSGAKIGLIGDWGTGAGPAQRVLQQLQRQNPDVLVHLGDIYYSGTEGECRTKFQAIIDQVFDRPRNPLPVYTLSGNHDMYCGGVGYYALLRRLNQGLKGPTGQSMDQPASFFCLRAEDQSWQLLAMDTGRNDYSPFSVTDIVTFVDPTEQDWLRRRMQEFSGKTILLSHHQLFSAFSQIGTRGQDGRWNPVNPKLRDTYMALTATNRRIAAWFWGHEHNLCVYQPYAGLQRGRCLGCSAIPVFVNDTPYQPLAGIDNPPRLIENTTLSNAGQFYTHAFAVLTLGSNGIATADYFEDAGDRGRRLYTESIS